MADFVQTVGYLGTDPFWNDPVRGFIFFDGVHLASRDLVALHRAAESLGLRREWFQDREDHPHYDLKGTPAQRMRGRDHLPFPFVYCNSRYLVSRMNDPRRVQRLRTAGWRMPPNTRYVGRGTAFGNYFFWGPTPQEAVEAYRKWLLQGLAGEPSATGYVGSACDALAGYPRRNEVVRRLPELRGKNLACWCRLVDADGNRVPCHADVLLELANREEDHV